MITVQNPSSKISTRDSVQPAANHAGYYVSDIYETLGYKSKEDFESTLSSTFEAFYSCQISIKENFKQVFRFNEGKMYTDWRISPLAYNFLQSNSIAVSK